MRYRGRKHARNGERGVTMVLVAIAMVAMLGMVALAVDVITMYAARSEAQRAADSAALAAAKMLVDAGVTGDPGNSGLQTTAQGFATQAAQSVAQQIAISGRPVQTADVNVTYPNNGQPSFGINPTVAVTVTRPNVPTFFSRIWSRAALSVSATATAEAFNPSNSSSVGGGTAMPVIARGVKPFLLPNCDPGVTGASCAGSATTFFNVSTGALTRPGQAPGGVIGEVFILQSNCGAGPGCVPGAPQAGQYYPAAIPGTPTSCPGTCGGGTNFEQNIECYNSTPLSCSTTVSGATQNTLTVDTTVYPDGGGGPAQSGTQCLIHEQPANGQDALQGNNNPAPPGAGLTYPLQIQLGDNHPLIGTPGLSAGDYVTTSDSIVTVPVYDDVAALTSAPANGSPPTAGAPIVGFLQLFINRTWPGGGGPKAGSFTATVLNVAGCGNAASGTPVFPGSTSAVPVRLIHQ
jgi:Flp pilus assembly protein TadG